MSKVLQERGFRSLSSSTKTNPRDYVKSISTIVETDASLIRQKGSYEPQFSEAYSCGTSHINKSIPRKEKDPGSFTLPCYINNVCFDNALADLGASVSVMPLSTYLNLGLGELAHTKLTVELADRTMKYLKGIAENVLVGLRERMELDLEARLMGETLVLNRSLDPLYGDYIELNDLNVPLELRRDQVDDLMPTIEEGKWWKIWMAAEIKTWEILFLENRSVKLHVWKQNSKQLSNANGNKIKPFTKGEFADMLKVSASYQRIQEFLQGAFELRMNMFEIEMEEWLTQGKLSGMRWM
ncbi:ribonuclease H-like domain-containing protein [Tanacetum coccineum]